jgi:two-component system sensor histidine kinase/response regulator
VVSTMLEKWGITSTIASNGNEALSALDETPFDFILMDCHMPEMDGFNATRIIRSRGGFKHNKSGIPIVALTASAMKGDRQACSDVGMNDFLTKPIIPAALLHIVKKWLKNDPSTAGENENQPDITDNSDAIWIPQELLDRSVGNKDLMKKLLKGFVEQSPERMVTLDTHSSSGDNIALREAVHSLKGVAGTFGAHKLAGVCQDLEEALWNDQIDNLPAMFLEVKKNLSVFNTKVADWLVKN